MQMLMRALNVAAIAVMSVASAADAPVGFTMDTLFLVPPPNLRTIGDSHGDIAVSPEGDVYVSVQGGAYKGIQVYSANGRYLRNVPGAPDDLHAFIISSAGDGRPSIYGVRRRAEEIVRLNLEGEVIMTVRGESIPERFKETQNGGYKLALSGVAVAPSGDIYAVDGYGMDFIHRFDSTGKYKGTFGGRDAPWKFKNCHKLGMDTRFEPARLLCTDRLNGRLVHMDLDGKLIGTFAEGLRWPSAVAVFRNDLAVAELSGRLSILGINGETIAQIGTNDNRAEVLTKKVSPENWRLDQFHSPHGVAYDALGNLFVTEWNEWGRVIRVSRSGN